MQQDSYNMPGVIDVRYLDPEDVSGDIISSFLAGIPVSVFVDGTQVSIHGEATCQATEEHAANGRNEKATLTFMTVDDVPREGVVWMIQQASSDWYLIGCREKPYPTVKIQTATGQPGGDRAIKTVTVEYSAYKALIPLER